ncbi:MAG TPA: hypothetical protein VIG64_11165, partial [Actinomycetota bacterium]
MGKVGRSFRALATSMVVVVAALVSGPASHAAREPGPGIRGIRRLRAETRAAVLDLDPAVRRAFRQARQLEERTIDNYRPVSDLNEDGTREILVSRWDLTSDPTGTTIFPSGTFTGTVLDGR